MEKRTLITNPAIPYDPNITQWGTWTGGSDYAIPWIFTNWVEETLSWKEGCYLSASLSGNMADNVIEGPDAVKLLSHCLVNGFDLDKFPVGKLKHGICVSPKGNITIDGLVFRDGPDKFTLNGPEYGVLPYVAEGGWDVKVSMHEYEGFLYQIAGPTSLQVIEQLFKKDMHDLEFLHFRFEEVMGHKVRVCRVGMGGTLAYEIHGTNDAADDIYNELRRVGEPLGLKRLGQLAYMCNHTENGFPQVGTHFMYAMSENPVFQRLFGGENGGVSDEFMIADQELHGSMADQGMEALYANPFELGWGKMINWNHDFVGKEALLKQRGNVRRNLKTLVWNPDDIADIYRSQFTEDPSRPIDEGGYFPGAYGTVPLPNDWVLDLEGNKIGFSGGRMMDWWNKAMISMAVMDVEFCEDGTEVQVLWGEPGTHQKLIRATVAPVPFNTHLENRSTDVSKL